MIKGSKQSFEARAKMSNSRKGRVISPEWRKKLGDSQRGKPKKPLSESAKQKLRNINLGKKLSEETKKKITQSLIGKFAKEKHPNWKGGITSTNHSIRHSVEYKLWRKSVFARDHYICIWCKDPTKKYIQADHIKPFYLYPKLRFAIDNGRTLCVDCHKKTETYGIYIRRNKTSE